MAENCAVKEITSQAVEFVSKTGVAGELFQSLSLEEIAMIGGGHATVNTI